MRMGWVIGALLACWLMLAGAVQAQCTKDADCKGTRICNQGECVEPTGPRPPPPPGMVRTVAPSAALEPPATGWATGSAILGFVFGGLTLALTGGTAATAENDDPIPVAPLAAFMLLNSIVMTPVVSTGSASARRLYPDVRGSVGLRVTAWVSYSLSLALILPMLVYAMPDVDLGPPHPALIGTCGLMGSLGMILMAADSLVSRSDAIDYYQAHGGKLALEFDDEPAFEFAPVVAPVIDLDGRGTSGATLGLAGRF